MFGYEKKFKDLLVRLCFQLAEKQPDELIRLAKEQDKQVERNGDVLRISSKMFTSVIRLGDSPLEQLLPVMYALFGPLWELAFEKDFKKASEEIDNLMRSDGCGRKN